MGPYLAKKTGGWFPRRSKPARSMFIHQSLGCLVGLLWLAASPLLQAHPGGLDSMGCHHDRQKGGYHCHRGPLAGQSFSSKEEAQKALRAQKTDKPKSPAGVKPDGADGKKATSGNGR
jgi:hypothetical protein